MKDFLLNCNVFFYLYEWGSDGKESTCNVGDLGSIPGSRRSPGEGNGYPLQYSCLENSMDKGAWWATVHGVAKSPIENIINAVCGQTIGWYSSFIHSLIRHALSAWGLWARLCAKSVWNIYNLCPVGQAITVHCGGVPLVEEWSGLPWKSWGGFLGEGPFELDLEDEVVLEVSSKGTSRK